MKGKEIANKRDILINSLKDFECNGLTDISDLGNEIGWYLGKLTNEEIIDFLHGIIHGIKLNNPEYE